MPYHSEAYACYVDEKGAIMRAPICLHTNEINKALGKPFKPPQLQTKTSDDRWRDTESDKRILSSDKRTRAALLVDVMRRDCVMRGGAHVYVNRVRRAIRARKP